MEVLLHRISFLEFLFLVGSEVMNNIMVDLETMGNTKQAAIIAIGAVKFDREGLGETFYRKVSLQSSVEAGLEMDPSTVLWWLRQDDDARLPMSEEDNNYSLASALQDFSSFVKEDDKVWGNGADFDNAILSSAYNCCKLPLPWKFWNNRCYRTLKNMFPSVQKPDLEGTKHNALYDAMLQGLHLIAIMAHVEEHGLKLEL